MSYLITGVTASSFSHQPLPSDEYSIPASHRSIEAKSANYFSLGSGTGPSATPAKVVTPGGTAVAAKAGEAKQPLKTDTVTLSTSEKVRSLQREGESDQQIAATLNLPTKEVQSDLHIASATHQSYTVAPVVSSLSNSAAPAALTTAESA